MASTSDKPTKLVRENRTTENEDAIHCVFSVDDDYCQHLAVALASLLAHNAANPLRITVLHEGLSNENQRRLRTITDRSPNAVLGFQALDTRSFGHFPQVGHLRLATYFRLFMPLVLPAEIKKVLYLDSDIAVLSDIRPLWEIDLNGHPAAAVPEYWKIHHARLGLPDDARHFNSGVMLMDLDRWRSDNLPAKFSTFIEQNATIIRNCDQDAMNVVLVNDVRLLDLEWNYQIYMRHRHLESSGLSRERYEHIVSHARIVHYAGNRKPWRYRDDVRYEKEYLHYIRQTPWRSFRQPDKTLRNIMRRYIRRYAPWLLAAARLRARR